MYIPTFKFLVQGQQVDVRITNNAPEVGTVRKQVSQGKTADRSSERNGIAAFLESTVCARQYLCRGIRQTGREIARQEEHSFGNTDHYVLKQINQPCMLTART